MKIELDDDTVDFILQQGLLSTYVSLGNEIDFVKLNPNNEFHHPDDIENWKKVRAAIEQLGSWYFVDFKKQLREFKKKNK